MPGVIISILVHVFALESDCDTQSFVQNRSNPSYMADATGWVGACILVRACALPPESANGDLPISVRSASWFFCLGIVFPSQYRPGGTGRIRNGFYRSKNSYLIHHNIVFSAWQLFIKSVIQVNRQLDVSGGFRTWLSASY